MVTEGALDRDRLRKVAETGRGCVCVDVVDVRGRDAGVAAMYSADKLVKFLVVLLAADENGGLLEYLKRNIANAYGTPSEQRGLATIWPERGGTLVWITLSEDRQIRVHYEAAGWPAESRKRKEGRTTGD